MLHTFIIELDAECCAPEELLEVFTAFEMRLVGVSQLDNRYHVRVVRYCVDEELALQEVYEHVNDMMLYHDVLDCYMLRAGIIDND